MSREQTARSGSATGKHAYAWSWAVVALATGLLMYLGKSEVRWAFKVPREIRFNLKQYISDFMGLAGQYGRPGHRDILRVDPGYLLVAGKAAGFDHRPAGHGADVGRGFQCRSAHPAAVLACGHPGADVPGPICKGLGNWLPLSEAVLHIWHFSGNGRAPW